MSTLIAWTCPRKQNFNIKQITFNIGVNLECLFGLFINRYIHYRIDATPDDPRWVGAWWVGFAVAAGAGVTVVMVMACFAPELPGQS